MHMDMHKPVKKYTELQKGQREWKMEHRQEKKDKIVKVLHIFRIIIRKVILTYSIEQSPS